MPVFGASAGGGQQRVLLIAGAVAAVAVIVVLAIVLGGNHHSSNDSPQTVAIGGAGAVSQPHTDTSNVDSALRNLATAEESYLTDHGAYASSASGMSAEGFHLDSYPDITIEIGYDGDIGYCLLGSTSFTDAWRVYDSESGGLQQTTFSDEPDASADCSDPAITSFDDMADDSGGSNDIQSDLRNAATAEESYLTDYDTYTNSLSDLSDEGFDISPGSTISAGYDGASGYCLVGSNDGYTWYLYDDHSGGMNNSTFDTENDAEYACSQNITNFG